MTFPLHRIQQKTAARDVLVGVFSSVFASVFLLTNATAAPASSASASVPVASAPAASTPLTPALQVVQQSARSAQQRCHEFMHEDADEYVSCLNALLKQVKGKDVKATQQRLGISYFAWIGANNAARLGLAGSEQAAKTYLPQFRLWQKQLNISDEALCSTVVGECAPRLAQMLQLEKEITEQSKERTKEHSASHPTKAAKPSKAADKSSSKNAASGSTSN